MAHLHHTTYPCPLNPSKATVILLHAAWMSSSMFADTVTHLRGLLPDTNLLTPDLNGHGETTVAQGSRDEFSLWDQAQDVVALMDALSIARAHILGISMGSLVALRLALLFPSRVSSLLLLASSASSAPAEEAAAFAQVRDIWISTPAPSEGIMDASILAWGGDAVVAGPRAERIKAHWVRRHAGAENVDAVLDSVGGREDLLKAGRLAEVKCPVLIVHGEFDETWKVEEALKTRDALVGSEKVRLEIVKGSGHLVLEMRDSEDVSRLIAGFLMEVAAWEKK